MRVIPRLPALCYGDRFSLATDASTSRITEGTDGANPEIEGDILEQVCVELPNSSAPIHVVIHVVHRKQIVELKAGWVRGPSDHGGAGALVWNGELSLVVKTNKQPRLFIFARNDTDGTLVPIVHWTVRNRE